MWSAAEDIDDAVLQGMLDAAADACEAWLPDEDDPERPRDTTIRMGQLTLVRGLWNDAIADEAGTIGGDGFDYSPPWLAREARRMMRPPRGGRHAATGHDDLDDDDPIPDIPAPAPAIVLTDLGTPDTGTAVPDVTVTFARAAGIASLTVATATGVANDREVGWSHIAAWPASFSHPPYMAVQGTDPLLVYLSSDFEQYLDLYLYGNGGIGHGPVTIYWADAGDDIGAGP